MMRGRLWRGGSGGGPNGCLAVAAGTALRYRLPRAGLRFTAASGQELNPAWPQEEMAPLLFERLSFNHLLSQPRDGAERREAERQA